MNQDIARIIQDFKLDDFRPIVHRELDLGEPLEPRAGNLATVVMGVRRCGKTYRLFQEMESLEQAGVSPDRMLYFNFEDDRLAPVTSQTGDEVLQAYFEMYPESYEQGVYFFFDEIQEMVDWDIWLRRVIDTTKATIYVSGSSSKLLSEEVASAFRGRSVAYELSPYSFRECLRLLEPDVSFESTDAKPLVLSSEEEARVKRSLDEYLVRGGFPAVQEVSLQRAVRVLQGYAQQVVAKDVLERHNLGNPQAVSLFAQRLLVMSGRTLSIRKVENSLRSQGVAVGRSFLSSALGYFEDAFLLSTLSEFSRALSPSSSSMPKVYAVDVGLVMANSPAASQDMGQRLETLVYDELRRRASFGRPGSLSSYRTERGAYEIDFVVGDALSGRGFELYQVSESVQADKTREREFRALGIAMEELGLDEGFLIVSEGEQRDLSVGRGTVHETPLWRWLLS